MRELILLLLAALLLGACSPTPEDRNEKLVRALNVRTVALLKSGKYAEAEPLARAALDQSERVLGVEHPDTLTSVSNLAALCDAQGRYGEAEALSRRALATRERVLGTEHPNTLISVNNLAYLYREQARYGEAEPLFHQALDASERALGAEHPQTLQSVNNLAAIYDSQGRYGEAEPLYLRALKTRERVLGRKHPDTLESVNNLAFLYSKQGRDGEAEPLFRQASQSAEQVLGGEHPTTINYVNNLAALYQKQGRSGEAEPLMRRALESNKRALGPEHRQTLTSVSNLAFLYGEQGRYGEAESLCRGALEIRERVLGTEHPDTLDSVNNLAGLYLAQGRNDEAEPLLRRALDSYERVLGAEHRNTINVQLGLVLALVNRSNLTQTLDQLRLIDTRLRGLVGLQLATTRSERVRRQLVDTESRLQDVVFTLALTHPDSDALPLAADILLRWKRLAGEADALVARLARTSQDPRVRDLASRLAQSRTDLSRLVNLPKPAPKAIAEARAGLERLEVELATLERTFGSQRAARGLAWESIRDALPQSSALLELRAFRPFDFKIDKRGELHWLALLIPANRGGGPPLQIFDLGPTAPLTPLLARLRVGDPDAQSQLYRSLFSSLDSSIKGLKTVFLAPDGALDLVSFAQLKLPDGRYWVQRQSVRELRTGRDLLVMRPDHEGAGMLLMGGIDYDRFPAVATAPGSAGPAASPAASGKGSKGETLRPVTLVPEMFLAMNRRLRDERSGFDSLVNTGPEARQIARFYWDKDNPAGVVLTGLDANERRLKSLAKPPRALHLATHGFFLAEQSDAPTGGWERPMVLSGIALAGANRGLDGQQGPDGENGILYALEAIDLNLEGTELVTLSACDTGKGAVDASEGVYGLVRAFQIAGARNVLMTLWPLNDPLARAFMEDFYRSWLDPQGRSPAEALRKIQLDWIRDGDARKRDPKYWAPFVLVERG